MTDKLTGTIYTSVERDNRLRWHPVIEIRVRGQWVRTITGLQGYYDRQQAEKEAAREAQRLEKGQTVG